MFASFDGPGGAALLQAAGNDINVLKITVASINDRKLWAWNIKPKDITKEIDYLVGKGVLTRPKSTAATEDTPANG